MRGSEATGIVVAGEESVRLLLRALLRLNHFWVEGEATGVEQALKLVRDHHPQVMLVDVNLAQGTWPVLVTYARAIVPGLRVVLTATATHPPAPRLDEPERPDAILLRPFRINEFAEAVLPRAIKKDSRSPQDTSSW